MLLKNAQRIAEEFCRRIAPYCDRVQIAGSVRRESAQVKDVEIVCIPATRLMRPAGSMFEEDGQPLYPFLDQAVKESGSCLAKDEAMPRWGERYRRLIYTHPAWQTDNRIVIDLFLTIPGSWGLILALRTGPADFSKLLVTQRSKAGLLPDDCQVSGGYVYRGNSPVPLTEEEQFFKLLGCPCWEARRRSVLLAKRHIDQRNAYAFQ